MIGIRMTWTADMEIPSASIGITLPIAYLQINGVANKHLIHLNTH